MNEQTSVVVDVLSTRSQANTLVMLDDEEADIDVVALLNLSTKRIKKKKSIASNTTNERRSHYCARPDADDCKLLLDDDDEHYTTAVRQWTERVPIGLGLCPWAIKSNRQERLYYKICEGSSPSEVASQAPSTYLPSATIQYNIGRVPSCSCLEPRL